MIYILSFISAAYWVASKNKDCPINEIIPTESDCKAAAAQQALEYKHHITSSERPAGCYKNNGTYWKYIYFNTVIDPSATLTTNDAAGLCRQGSDV